MDDEQKLFKERFLEHRFLLHRIIGRYIRHKETQQDLMQETMLLAWKCRADYQGLSKYSTWLCRIAINATINYLIAQKRKPLSRAIDYTLVEGGCIGEHAICNSAESILIADEGMHEIRMAIFKLPQTYKTALVLQAFYGLTYEQIADVANIPVGTVRSRIYRAKELLRQQLQPL